MNIFKQIGKSIYSPEFYADLAKQPTSFAVKYFFKFLLLLSLLVTIVLSIIAIPSAHLILKDESVKTFVKLYPAELNVKVTDGVFSTNVVEPYAIPVTTKDKEYSNLAVIDTGVTAVSLESFKAYDTYILITKDSAVSVKNNSVLQVTPVAQYFKSGTEINQSTIESLALDSAPLVRKLLWLVPIFVYITSYVGGVFSLVTAFIWALFVWLLLVILKKSTGYMHAYRVTIHAMTFGLIIGAINHLAWYLGLPLALLLVVANFKGSKKTPEVISKLV